MRSERTAAAPKWTKNVLYAAAVYNLAWGAAVILAPLALFHWAGMGDPKYPQIWQCVGMIVGVYGVGYWIAARDPFRHWPIVLVGLLGKILGPIGFLNAAWEGSLPWKWGMTIITNDLIWWVPFVSILYLAFRSNTDTSRGTPATPYREAIRSIRSHRNATLMEISSTGPTVVVFLRHAGCTFCRQTLSEMQKIACEIDHRGANLAIVHMGSPMDGTLMLEARNLRNVHHFSDPKCTLYRAFGLERGTLRQLFSPGLLTRGVKAILAGHGIGSLSGDGFRMPGAFVVIEGKIIAEHRAETAAEIPDFLALLTKAESEYRPRRVAKYSRTFAAVMARRY